MGQALVLHTGLLDKVKSCIRLVLSVRLLAAESDAVYTSGGRWIRVVDTVAPAAPSPEKCRPIPAKLHWQNSRHSKWDRLLPASAALKHPTSYWPMHVTCMCLQLRQYNGSVHNVCWSKSTSGHA